MCKTTTMRIETAIRLRIKVPRQFSFFFILRKILNVKIAKKDNKHILAQLFRLKL